MTTVMHIGRRDRLRAELHTPATTPNGTPSRGHYDTEQEPIQP